MAMKAEVVVVEVEVVEEEEEELLLPALARSSPRSASSSLLATSFRAHSMTRCVGNALRDALPSPRHVASSFSSKLRGIVAENITVCRWGAKALRT